MDRLFRNKNFPYDAPKEANARQNVLVLFLASKLHLQEVGILFAKEISPAEGLKLPAKEGNPVQLFAVVDIRVPGKN